MWPKSFWFPEVTCRVQIQKSGQCLLSPQRVTLIKNMPSYTRRDALISVDGKIVQMFYSWLFCYGLPLCNGQGIYTKTVMISSIHLSISSASTVHEKNGFSSWCRNMGHIANQLHAIISTFASSPWYNKLSLSTFLWSANLLWIYSFFFLWLMKKLIIIILLVLRKTYLHGYT